MLAESFTFTNKNEEKDLFWNMLNCKKNKFMHTFSDFLNFLATSYL